MSPRWSGSEPPDGRAASASERRRDPASRCWNPGQAAAHLTVVSTAEVLEAAPVVAVVAAVDPGVAADVARVVSVVAAAVVAGVSTTVSVESADEELSPAALAAITPASPTITVALASPAARRERRAGCGRRRRAFCGVGSLVGNMVRLRESRAGRCAGFVMPTMRDKPQRSMRNCWNVPPTPRPGAAGCVIDVGDQG